MKGTPHDVFLDLLRNNGGSDPGVAISNCEDPWYACLFETPAEVDEFIMQIEAACNEKWPGELERVRLARNWRKASETVERMIRAMRGASDPK